MARIKQPREIAILKGAHLKDPQRYEGEPPKSSLSIGEAPGHMGANAQSVWMEIQSVIVDGVLTATDRVMFETLCNLVAEYREDPKEFAVGKYSHLISCLARFGMSPSDRGKLAIEKPKEDDDFEVL